MTARSISDDDLCSDCTHCGYQPGEQSTCAQAWPGDVAAGGHPREGYVIACWDFAPIAKQGENWTGRRVVL